MKVVLQRVRSASVSVDDQVISSIDRGYLLLLGVMEGDSTEQADWLAEKIVKLRVFDSKEGKMNDQSILDIDGEILVVSQFTLAGRVEKGNRPDFIHAADPSLAQPIYEGFVQKLRDLGVQKVETGQFGAYMQVELVNDGPMTLVLDR